MLGLHILFEQASTFIACRQTTLWLLGLLIWLSRRPIVYSVFTRVIATRGHRPTARNVLFSLSQLRRRNSTRNFQ